MTDLNNDLLEEILVRLPVRSLVRLKSVCKSWCNLIKSPRFIHMHMIRQRTSGKEFILVVCDDLETYRPKYLKIYTYFRDIESLDATSSEYNVQHHNLGYCAGHSNGILCITDWDFNVFLFNPALREIRPLPIIPSWRPATYVEHGVGFGFDQATNDYKVVRIINTTEFSPDGSSPFMEVEIYNLSTNRWRNWGTIAEPPSIFYTLGSSIYFRGLIHWPAFESSRECCRVLTLNTTTELFEELSFPAGVKVTPPLFVMDDSTLGLVAYTRYVEFYGWTMDVWVMKEYGVSESWTRLYSVPPPPTCTIDQGSWRLQVSFAKKDKLVMVSPIGECIFYDSATGQYSQIRQFEAPGMSGDLRHFELVICHESLFSTYSTSLVL